MSEQNTKALNNEAKAENTAESPATPSEIILEDTVSKKNSHGAESVCSGLKGGASAKYD